MFDHFAWRTGEVVAYIEDLWLTNRCRWLFHRCEDRRGNVLNMDTAENLTRFVDDTRTPLADRFQRIPPRTIDTRQPEDVQRQAQIVPCRLCFQPCHAAPRLAAGLRRLIDPGTVPVAIDYRRRKVTSPSGLEIRCQWLDQRQQGVVASFGRADGLQQMGGFRQSGLDRIRQGRRLGCIQNQSVNPGLPEPLGLFRAADGSADPPALGKRKFRQGLTGETETKTEKMLRTITHAFATLSEYPVVMKLSVLFRAPSLALILLLSSLGATAWAFEPDEVADGFRGTFVNCMAKGQSDPVNGRQYAAEWLASEAGGEIYARYCLAVWTFQSGEPTVAAELLMNLADDQGVRDTPQSTRFLVLAGDIFDSIGAFPEAFRAFSRVLDQNRFDPEIWVSRALVRASMGDFEGTIADLDLALALEADNVEALVFRGSTFLAVDELNQAADDALQALLLEPFNTSALWLRAQISMAEGDAELAIKDLERIIERGEGGLRDQAQEALAIIKAANQKSTLE